MLIVLSAPSAASPLPPSGKANAPLIFAQAEEQPVSPPNTSPANPGPATPSPAKKSPPEEAKPIPSVTIIDAAYARGVLGREVRSAADESMGRIVDVIVDRAGRVRAAIIDFGGFLGVGSRKIAVDWKALHFGRIADKSDTVTLELTREQVRPAPEYKEGKQIVVLGAAGSLEPLRFIGPMTLEK
ncbi:PRC-barrel domain-containing protein [Roseiarcaceae bacterium H3SJ34-1]|uniref:PRC-barrel domain-containing protein n=1 Tax=Terripilifer ovatus TaxID=3032367 RepID=UPI003AB99CF4|nr:PRC-barrel domain-containing protein [Roseiarcaceae bacterium H3SJ34-1]